MERKVRNYEKGIRAIDGAGVHLVRVLGHNTTDEYDPFLMLDSFDSTDPEDYIKGFPMHPHRGIETITYLSSGSFQHKDSLGNKKVLKDGGVQWMTTGSGILHEEMPIASERMLGVQLWLNLPKKYKMVPPSYYDISNDDMTSVDIENGRLRIVSGEYEGKKGHIAKYLPLTYYIINLEKNSKFSIPSIEKDSAFVFLLKGDAKVAGEKFDEKTAVSTTEGDILDIESLDEDIEILYLSAPRLDEPISWGGPIVMNSQEELQNAFMELRNNTFLKSE